MLLHSQALVSGHHRLCRSGTSRAFAPSDRADGRSRASQVEARARKRGSGSGSSTDQQEQQQGGARLSAAALAAAFTLTLVTQAPVQPALAVLNSPNAAIARSPDAALRRSIPAFNLQVKEIQTSLEEIAYLLRIPQRKPYGSMANNVADALKQWDNRNRLLEGVPAAQREQASKKVDELYAALKKLELAIGTQQPDYVGLRASEALSLVAELELLQAPGLPFSLPKDYQSLPYLTGRAVVELKVERGDGSPAFVDQQNGGLESQGTIVLTIDGYSAPITAGNFVANVLDGRYDGRKLVASATAVLTGPSPPSKPELPPVPLEILPLGEFEPEYRLPLDVQGGELPVLPLSIAGAVSMSHIPGSESYLSGDEWFMFRFDKQQAGLAGLAFDEGTFGVFAYVTEGEDVMNRLQTDDVIVKAKVVSGADRLVRPSKQ